VARAVSVEPNVVTLVVSSDIRKVRDRRSELESGGGAGRRVSTTTQHVDLGQKESAHVLVTRTENEMKGRKSLHSDSG
jgi:hypothetical protein